MRNILRKLKVEHAFSFAAILGQDLDAELRNRIEALALSTLGEALRHARQAAFGGTAIAGALVLLAAQHPRNASSTVPDLAPPIASEMFGSLWVWLCGPRHRFLLGVHIISSVLILLAASMRAADPWENWWQAFSLSVLCVVADAGFWLLLRDSCKSVGNPLPASPI